MTTTRRLMLILALTGGAILARPAAAQDTPEAPKQQKAKYDRNKIVRAEIDERASDAKTAYDIVRRLRPQFLRARPSGSIQNRSPVPIKVYVNGAQNHGGVDYLNSIAAESVQEIEYLNGQDATTRFGTDHESGAIMIRTGAR